MRLDFDHKTPLAEQFTRAGNRKKVGRKHEKRLGPTRYGARQDGQACFRRQREMATCGIEDAGIRSSPFR